MSFSVQFKSLAKRAPDSLWKRKGKYKRGSPSGSKYHAHEDASVSYFKPPDSRTFRNATHEALVLNGKRV
jgi:hypothetical protein